RTPIFLELDEAKRVIDLPCRDADREARDDPRMATESRSAGGRVRNCRGARGAAGGGTARRYRDGAEALQRAAWRGQICRRARRMAEARGGREGPIRDRASELCPYSAQGRRDLPEP